MKAVQIRHTVFALLAAIGSAAAEALGGWDTALQVLTGFMAADYVTGLLVAAVWHRSEKSASGALESNACFKGLLRKGVVLLVVWMAAMLDRAAGTAFVCTAACMFFIANEGISILENTAIMGVPYPSFVKDMLEVMRESADSGREAGDE